MTSDPAVADELGHLRPMQAPFAARWDPMGERFDFEWIGEDEGGVWIRLHPDRALQRYPGLWMAVERFRAGIRDITRADWECLSSYEFEAHVALVSAYRRQESRIMKRVMNREGPSHG